MLLVLPKEADSGKPGTEQFGQSHLRVEASNTNRPKNLPWHGKLLCDHGRKTQKNSIHLPELVWKPLLTLCKHSFCFTWIRTLEKKNQDGLFTCRQCLDISQIQRIPGNVVPWQLVAEIKVFMPALSMNYWMWTFCVFTSLDPAMANSFLIFLMTCRVSDVWMASRVHQTTLRHAPLWCVSWVPLALLWPPPLGGRNRRVSWIGCESLQEYEWCQETSPVIFSPWVLGCES